MRIREITDIIERRMPLDTADEDDREKIGLQVGCLDGDCTGIVTCLDCTSAVVERAVKEGCNLVLSHHPLIYHALQEIDVSIGVGRIVEGLIKNGITVYSAHTNLDKCDIGTNATLLQLLGARFLKSDGCLFFAEIQPIALKDFAKAVESKLSDVGVRFVGEPDKIITKICVCSGGGGNTQFMQTAADGGADVYVSGDVSHHGYIYAQENEIALVEFSHYGSEISAEDVFVQALSDKCGNIKIIKANQRRPFRTLEEI